MPEIEQPMDPTRWQELYQSSLLVPPYRYFITDIDSSNQTIELDDLDMDDDDPDNVEEDDPFIDSVQLPTVRDELSLIRRDIGSWMITHEAYEELPEQYRARCHECNQDLDKRLVPVKATNTRGRYWCDLCCLPCLGCRGMYRQGVGPTAMVMVNCCSHECFELLFNCSSCRVTELRMNCSFFSRYEHTGRMERSYQDGSIGNRFCRSCASHFEYCETHDRVEDDRRDNACRMNLIHGYNSNPVLKFHSFGRKFGQPKVDRSPEDGQVYLGMELECECHGESRHRLAGAQILNKTMGKRIWMKKDGSLSNGIEICTHPMTLEYFKSCDWSGFNELLESGLHFRAWDSPNAGIHIHVGRTAFNTDSHLWKFGEMIVMNPEKSQKFAGRIENSFCRMTAERDSYGRVRGGKDLKKTISGTLLKKPGHQPAHYDAVNLSNENTVEVRIFRSSLRIDRILANLEFVDAVVRYTRDLKVSDVKDGALKWSGFRKWLDKQTQYDELLMFVDNGLEQLRQPVMAS